MKKIILILLSCLMICSMSSCEKKYDSVGNNKESTDNLDCDLDSTQNVNGQSNFDEKTIHNGNTRIDVTFDSYDSIINVYKKMVEITPDVIEEREIYNEKVRSLFVVSEAKMDWYSQLTKSISDLYPRDSSGLKNDGYLDFGYAVKDINEDNLGELILMLSNGTIIAIFTIHNNEPMLVDCFQNRYCCGLSGSGDICISGSNGAAQTVNKRFTLDPATAKLLLICEYGTEGFDSATGETIYYVNVNSIKTYLIETEYEDICEDNQAMTSSQLLESVTYISLSE